MIPGRLVRERSLSGAFGAAPIPDTARDRRQSGNEEDAAAAATALAKTGRFAESLAILTRALARNPEAPGLLYERALTLFDWGRLREASVDFQAAAARGLSTFGLHLNFGYACHLLGHVDEAEKHVRRAMALDGEAAIAHVGLGALMQAAKRFDEAIRSFERAYQVDPSRTDCLIRIASCRLEQIDAAAAEEAIRRAISIVGESQPGAWTALGTALSLQDRDAEASAAFERALAIEAAGGELADTFDRYGVHLLGVGRARQAMDLYAQHLASHPDPRAHTHYGWALLTAGWLREGWKQYEFRWCEEPSLSARQRFVGPRWNGQSLEGRTVVVWAEQGIGDTVHFARFAIALKAGGATVVLRVPEMLKDLAQGFLGVDRVIVESAELGGSFDYQIALMSLPCALGIELDSIPAQVPYLVVDAAQSQRWRNEIGPEGGIKVGLVWAGNPKHERDRFRSIPLEKLAPLWSTRGVRFYSLQKDHTADLSTHEGFLVDLSPHLANLVDTAAAVQALDLVICVDTAVAHIAGALGRPVWLMLPAAGDFRWLTDREDSPWYPTMRLFTQKKLGAWDEVVARVATTLTEVVKAGRPDPIPPSAQTRRTTAANRPAPDNALSQVAETRHGIVQYLPAHTSLARSLAWYGEWLQPQIELIMRLIRPGATVIEANSGIGAHALALAQALGPQGHLLAYEADPILHRILTQNLQMNGVRPLVTVLQRDLTCRQGGPGAGDGGQVSPREDKLLASDTIDELLLERLDLIKVNGRADPRRVLDGGEATIWRSRPILFLEQPTGSTLGELTEQVKRFSYRCWEVVTPFYSPGNYNRRPEDIFRGEAARALVAIPEEREPDESLRGSEEV